MNAGVQGRWTLVDAEKFRQAVWAVERESFRPGDALTAFERAQVPCDEAAVERVAEEMASWSGPVPGGVDGFRSFAERALHAAGAVQ
jgi:hypothetical protein